MSQLASIFNDFDDEPVSSTLFQAKTRKAPPTSGSVMNHGGSGANSAKASKVLANAFITLFYFNSQTNNYDHYGTTGLGIMKRENYYSLLLFRSSEDLISETIITKDLKIFVQNGYLTFYDNAQRIVSCMFGSQKELLEFSRKVALVKFASTDMKEISILDLTEGTGDALKVGDRVGIKYSAYSLINSTPPSFGSQFDTNMDQDGLLTFRIGQNTKNKGLEMGIVGMKISGNASRLIIVPSHLASAEGGSLSIPPNSHICFIVDLVKAKKSSETFTQNSNAIDNGSESDALSGIVSIHSEEKSSASQSSIVHRSQPSKIRDRANSYLPTNPALSLIADSIQSMESPSSRTSHKSKNSKQSQKSQKAKSKQSKQGKISKSKHSKKKHISSDESESESESESVSKSFSDESVDVKKLSRGKNRKHRESDTELSSDEESSDAVAHKKYKKQKGSRESKKESRSKRFDIPAKENKVSGDTLSILEKLSLIEDKIENLDISSMMKTKNENRKMIFMSGTVLMQNMQHFISENEALKNDLADEKQKVDHLVAQMKELKERNNSLTKHSFSFSEDDNFLQGELISAKKQVKSQQATIVQLTDELEQTTEERNALRVENASLTGQLDEAIQASRYNENRVVGLENDLGKLNQKLRDMLEQLETAKKQNEELIQENHSKSEEINKLQSRLSSEIKAKESTQTLLTESQETIRDLLDDRENKSEDIKVLQGKLQAIVKERDEFEKEVEDLESDREELIAKFRVKLEQVQSESLEHSVEETSEAVRVSMKQIYLNMKKKITNPDGQYSGEKILSALLQNVRDLTSELVAHIENEEDISSFEYEAELEPLSEEDPIIQVVEKEVSLTQNNSTSSIIKQKDILENEVESEEEEEHPLISNEHEDSEVDQLEKHVEITETSVLDTEKDPLSLLNSEAAFEGEPVDSDNESGDEAHVIEGSDDDSSEDEAHEYSNTPHLAEKENEGQNEVSAGEENHEKEDVDHENEVFYEEQAEQDQDENEDQEQQEQQDELIHDQEDLVDSNEANEEESQIITESEPTQDEIDESDASEHEVEVELVNESNVTTEQPAATVEESDEIQSNEVDPEPQNDSIVGTDTSYEIQASNFDQTSQQSDRDTEGNEPEDTTIEKEAFEDAEPVISSYYSQPMTEEEEKKKSAAALSLFSNDDDDFW